MSKDSDSRQRKVSQTILILLPVLTFLIGWFGHLAFTNVLDSLDQSHYYAQLIQQAWTDIDQNYVDRKAVNYQQLSYQAISAMLTKLGDNKHTRFLTPTDVQTLRQDLSGTYIGIGAYLRQDPATKKIIITSTISDSPAEKAGLQRGDIIVAVNGVYIAGKDFATVHSLIHATASKGVIILVQRSSTKQMLSIKVSGTQVIEPNVILHYIAEDHIAHIQIIQFANGISHQLKDTLSEAKRLGATSLILDLRDDPGGYVQEAINIASEFMAHGNVLFVQDGKGQRTPYPVSGSAINTSIPIVLLVNKNTASAAEILAGALQENNRATLIGTTTTGAGTILQEFDLSDGSAILVATAAWLTPKGHFIQDLGLTPTINRTLSATSIPITANDENVEHLTEQQILRSGDAQMVAAIHFLETHQAISTEHSQDKLSQQQSQATGLLAFDSSFFSQEA